MAKAKILFFGSEDGRRQGEHENRKHNPLVRVVLQIPPPLCAGSTEDMSVLLFPTDSCSRSCF